MFPAERSLRPLCWTFWQSTCLSLLCSPAEAGGGGWLLCGLNAFEPPEFTMTLTQSSSGTAGLSGLLGQGPHGGFVEPPGPFLVCLLMLIAQYHRWGKW
jgi:hypothetical protein